jgi:DNA-directed RNA polymerase II subunit RPB2
MSESIDRSTDRSIDSPESKLDLKGMPIPIPISKVTEPLNSQNQTIPGTISVDESGRLLKTYFTYKGIVQDIIDIFDDWITNKLKSFMESREIKISEDKTLRFESIIIKPPTYSVRTESFNLLPAIARVRKETYSGTLMCDLVIRDKSGKEISRKKNVSLGRIPIMLGSVVCHLRGKTETELIQMGECPTDPFGYFIISGIEYSLVTQEKLRVNKFIIFDKDFKGNVTCRMTIFRPYVGTTVFYLYKTNESVINIKFTKHDICVLSVYSIFKVSLEESLDMILSFINSDKNKEKAKYALQATINDYYKTDVSNIKPEDILRELFPNMEGMKLELRLQSLSLMTAKYLEFLIGHRRIDDRDHWANKRLESAGRLMEQLFVGIINKMFIPGIQEEISTKGLTDIKEIANIIKVNVITDEFRHSFNSKLWGVKVSKKLKESVVEQLKREGAVSIYSQLLKINTPTSQQTKQANIRMVQMSQLGYIDPVETPEGKKCGLVKHRAITCRYTIEREDVSVIKYIQDFEGIESPYESSENTTNTESTRTDTRKEKKQGKGTQKDAPKDTYVVVNGKFICWSTSGEKLYQYLLRLRRSGFIHYETSIVFDRKDKGIYLYTTGSRPIWPLLIVNQETNRLYLHEKKDVNIDDFLELLRQGIVEYIDPWEQDHITIAQSIEDFKQYSADLERIKSQMEALQDTNPDEAETLKISYQRLLKKRYTHCQIDPIAILGSSSSLMPLANFNQGPRLSYFCSMVKQALTQYHSNHQLRFDPTIKVLSWPTRPIFESQINRLLNLDRVPRGENVLCAFMAYTGYNQEDSLIFNKASIDEGKFMYTAYFRYYTALRNVREVTEKFGLVSDPEEQKNQVNLDENGIVKLGTHVKPDDILVRKIRIYQEKTRVIEDLKVLKYHEGIVDQIIKCRNAENAECIYIKIRDVRKPEIGDKFASRYAQKATIGIILPREDMPFNEETGIIPDVIINPHCIISRMTMGKLLEMLASKTTLLTGEYVNATAFRKFDYTEFQRILKQYGYDEYGLETLRSGITGELIKTKIFVGPCFYQATRHQVKDKIQMRARGSIKAITHQPISGRNKGGGLRFGEYEKDNLISHGASSILQERMLYASDIFQAVFCTNCGEIAISSIIDKMNICMTCGQNARFGKCSIPYAFKTLLHYLAATGISLKFKFRDLEKHIQDTGPQK